MDNNCYTTEDPANYKIFLDIPDFFLYYLRVSTCAPDDSVLFIDRCSPMACSRVEDILARLLSPGFSTHLQRYIDRFKADPQFLFFHASSTLLHLRVELEIFSDVLDPCGECPINLVSRCDVLDALEKAIRTRMAEQEGMAA